MNQSYTPKSRTLKPFPYRGADAALRDFLKKVIDGEYAFPTIGELQGHPLILDLGANIGSFAYWALSKYPNAIVYSFEPNPDNAKNYIQNLVEADVNPMSYRLFEAAVFPTENKFTQLYTSPINGGMHSMDAGIAANSDGISFIAKNIHPRDLPNSTFLKMDIEGAEYPVLKAYLETHPKPELVSFEFHSIPDRYALEELLGDDYILGSGTILDPRLGTLNYIRKDILASIMPV